MDYGNASCKSTGEPSVHVTVAMNHYKVAFWKTNWLAKCEV